MVGETKPSDRQKRKLLFAFFIGFAIVVMVFTRADWKKLMLIFSQIELKWACLALAASAASYLFIAAVMGSILRIIGYSLPLKTIIEISFISTTVNYIMSLAGLSGVATKVYLLARQRISPSKTLSISIVHGFMTNTVMVLFVYVGFFYILTHTEMTLVQIIAAMLILSLAFLLTWITVQIMISGEFRDRLYRFSMRILTFISRKPGGRLIISDEKAREFYGQFDDGMRLIFNERSKLIQPALYALLDWAFMILCLWASFKSVHYTIGFSKLLVGFSAAVFFTIISLTPAGLGLVEGSMAGVYFALGVPFECALVAVVVYRLAYYILPALTSFIFYHQFFYRERELKPDPSHGPAGN